MRGKVAWEPPEPHLFLSLLVLPVLSGLLHLLKLLEWAFLGGGWEFWLHRFSQVGHQGSIPQ